MEFDFDTAIAGTVQFAVGLGLTQLGRYLSQRIKGNVIRALLSWPCFGLGFILLASAVFTILWNMFGSFVLWLLSFAR
jgi:hypothetical protein